MDGSAYTSGLQTYGSVWICVSSSYKIRRKPAMEIYEAVRRHLDNGRGVLHVVLTMPHRSNEELIELWGILSDCWGHVASGGGWKTFRKKHDLLGHSRATLLSLFKPKRVGPASRSPTGPALPKR